MQKEFTCPGFAIFVAILYTATSITFRTPGVPMAVPTFIFDFDSTFVSVEALDELAALALENHPDRDRCLSEIKRITQLGMEGKLAYHDALAKRLHLLSASREHVARMSELLRLRVSPSFSRNQAFIQENAERVFIISGGFLELICPVAEAFGIPKEHVFANRFLFDMDGMIVGIDESLPLSRDGGKVEQLKQLNLSGPVVVVGDGYTDYEMRRDGLADEFIAFTENVSRQTVVDVADYVAADFDKVLSRYGLESNKAPRKRPKALLLENLHPDAGRALERQGYEVESLAQGLPEAELIEQLKGVQLLGIRSKTQVTARVLEDATDLLAIGAFCIGTNQVDLEACCREGIAVFHAPFSNTRSVVELAIGQILMLQRQVWDKSQKAHEGVWDKTVEGCVEARGKTLGIIGYGKIGSQLSVLAESLGMQVYYYDVMDRLPLGNARACASLNELLESSDVVSVHVDGSPGNAKLVGAEQFKRMRNGAIFLNLSRGSVVDVEALAEALRSGRVRGAAVDVFPVEPQSNDQPFATPLQGISNVILTPHIGGNTVEAQQHIGQFVSDRLIDYWKRGSTTVSVNFPQLQVPPLRAKTRIVHLHQNVPGMLAQITGLLAEHEINIVGQYLKTNEWVGYLIIDIDGEVEETLVRALSQIEHSKRVRVLQS